MFSFINMYLLPLINGNKKIKKKNMNTFLYILPEKKFKNFINILFFFLVL